MSNVIYLLKLKTQKVQSFIFKVPKLKSMLGANSLLGEFFAVDLPMLRRKHGEVPKYFRSVEKNENYKWETDDIFENFKNGIIASAGGHFEAIFCKESDAIDFLKEAIKKANEKLPGVGISYHLKLIKYKDENGKIISYEKYENEDKCQSKDCLKYKDEECIEDCTNYKNNIVKNIDIKGVEENFYYIDSPFFYPSEKDGENPELLKSKDNSMITKHIENQGDKFYNAIVKNNDYKKTSKDYLAEFYTKLKHDKGFEYYIDEGKELEILKGISLIPNNNMIAVIATDGNGMGNRFKEMRESLENSNKNLFEALIEIEKFWFEARNGFRTALESTLNNIAKKDMFKNYKKLPFVIMMLGGDDLLVVTVPELAFDFVTEFNKNLSESEDKITSCSGIAFVKHNYPFSHAHELAESLLDSAKKLSKMNKSDNAPQGVPAVDWHFQYSSLYDDIEEIRKRDYLLSYNIGNDNNEIIQTEILSMRPYLVSDLLKVKTDALNIFKKYNKKDGKEKLKGRNKYKKLRELIKEGKATSEHYMNLFLEKEKELFKYHEIIENSKIYTNNALDIIEMLELNERGGK